MVEMHLHADVDVDADVHADVHADFYQLFCKPASSNVR